MEEQKENYGLVYKGRPPYEVLYTRWLPYEDTLRLKGIEEMVEVYYNSRQFCYTLPWLERQFSDAFCMFEELAVYYEKHGFHLLNHSRTSRYEILLDFAGERDAQHLEQYRQLLILDFYLRENAKNRPEFAGEELLDKEEERRFYDREAEERNYLGDYETSEKRKLRKMTHLEKFSWDVMGNMESRTVLLLFDYQKRNPLNYQARVEEVENPERVLAKQE